MIEDAVPLAEQATYGIDGLVEYLDASGVDVIGVETGISPPIQTRAVASTFLRFSQGGGCNVLLYKSPDDARQFGARSGGGDTYTRLAKTFITGAFVETRTRYKPTYRFGPMVTTCYDEDPLVFRALRSLEEYAGVDP